jgi:opacity protein-like surface antigen
MLLMLRKRVLTLIVGLAGAGLTAAAQENVYKNEASVQAFGSFQKETTENNVRHDATNSGGVLATYRRFFTRHHGVEANYGYTLNTQRYSIGGATAGLKAHSHEATAAYVFRLPRDRFTPFALAGAGALVYSPDLSGLDLQAKPAFVYGAGADVNFSERWFMRAQYRGLLYNAPTLQASITGSPERLTHEARPSIGFGFRF